MNEIKKELKNPERKIKLKEIKFYEKIIRSQIIRFCRLLLLMLSNNEKQKNPNIDKKESNNNNNGFKLLRNKILIELILKNGIKSQLKELDFQQFEKIINIVINRKTIGKIEELRFQINQILNEIANKLTKQ